jgi:hypothetical protein
LIYINNVSQTVTTAVAFGTWPNIAAPLYIGQDTHMYPISWVTGNIKDLMIWNSRALTQPEIALLMIETSPITGSDVYPVMPGKRGVE